MVRKIKISLILLFCLVVGAACITGCFSSGDLSVPVVQKEDLPGEESEEAVDIDSKLSELKEKLVTPPVILSHTPNEQIYASGEKALIFIKGMADAGCSIETYVNEMLLKEKVNVSEEGYFEIINGVELEEGKNTLRLISVNQKGYKSKPTKFNLYMISAEGITYQVFDGSETLREIVDFYFVKESKPTVYLSGNYLADSQIFLQVNNKIVGESETSEEGLFSFSDVNLDLGSNEIAVWAVTSDGFTNAPTFTNIIVTEDMDYPFPSSLTGHNDSTGNNLSWTSSTDENFLSYKLVRVEDPCLNPDYPESDVIVTLEDKSVISYIDSDIEDGRAYFYTLWTLDKAGSVVSSNVLAIPQPVYSMSIEKLQSFDDNYIGRREWYYQYYDITNNGNITLDIQPIMVHLILDPEPNTEMLYAPLWEIHIWDPDTGEYYYSKEDIDGTYVSDYMNLGGTTETEETTTYSTDGNTKTVTQTETTKKTADGQGKRIMTTTVNRTITETDLTTNISTVTNTTDTTTEIVEPERIGSLIEGLDPGEKRTIAVKIQNIYAKDGVTITAHFHFAPVDCEGYFHTDERVSTGDIMVRSSGRN